MIQLKKIKEDEQEYEPKQSAESEIICTHCQSKIFTAKLIGMSLVCPYCNKPCDELYTEEIMPINGLIIS